MKPETITQYELIDPETNEKFFLRKTVKKPLNASRTDGWFLEDRSRCVVHPYTHTGTW